MNKQGRGRFFLDSRPWSFVVGIMWVKMRVLSSGERKLSHQFFNCPWKPMTIAVVPK